MSTTDPTPTTPTIPTPTIETIVSRPDGPVDERTTALAADLITFLETNQAPDGLFTDDVFCDLTVPQWRLQARGREGAVALRTGGHPWTGRVPRARLDVTGSGFVLEVEETWDADGGPWYCRELIRCDVADGSISEMAVYCTGDWDREQVERHAREVQLLRP